MSGRILESNWVRLALIVTVAVLLVSGVLYYLLVLAPALSIGPIKDPAGDVLLNLGSNYPGMVDIVGGSLEEGGNTMNVSVDVAEAVSGVNVGEFARWDVTLVLENGSDVLGTFELHVEINATGFFGVIQNLEDESSKPCQVNSHGNTLTAVVVFDRPENPERAEWRIISTYEKFSGEELIASSYDFAPDNGMQTTVFED